MEFNPKFAALAAVCAFIFSLFLGLLSGAGVGLFLLRAVMFAVIFFVLAAIATVIAEKLLKVEEPSNAPQTEGEMAAAEKISPNGQKVNIFDNDDEDAFQSETTDPGTAPPADETPFQAGVDFSQDPSQEGLEQNNNFQYTQVKGVDSVSVAVPSGTTAKNTAQDEDPSLSFSDFVPVAPSEKEEDGESGVAEKQAPEKYEMGTVEMSVAKDASKKIELSDLGAQVDERKVAQAIQTLLKKDGS